MLLPEHMHTLLADNLSILEQARSFLQTISSAQYAQPVAVCFRSSIGGHFRHALDHYVSFDAGLESGRIDYEARARDTRLERELDYALLRLEHILARLRENLATLTNSSVAVRLENHADTWADSTLSRELQFLLSHTVHHWALVTVCASAQGIKTPPDFGVAPSTLRHRAATPSPATQTAPAT